MCRSLSVAAAKVEEWKEMKRKRTMGQNLIDFKCSWKLRLHHKNVFEMEENLCIRGGVEGVFIYLFFKFSFLNFLVYRLQEVTSFVSLKIKLFLMSVLVWYLYETMEIKLVIEDKTIIKPVDGI